MPKIDIDIVKRKIKLIEADLLKLKDYKELTLSEYIKDENTQLVVERLLERISGRIINLNYHILREEYEIMPQDYYNSFIEVGKNKIVTEELANEIAGMAGLRNALAHEYDKIDQKLIFDSLKKCLLLVPNYLKVIINFVN